MNNSLDNLEDLANEIRKCSATKPDHIMVHPRYVRICKSKKWFKRRNKFAAIRSRLYSSKWQKSHPVKNDFRMSDFEATK